MLKLGWDLVFTIINLVVLFLLLRKFLYKPVMNIMEQRQELIDNQFKSAKEAEDKANELQAQWKENMSTAEAEKAKILDNANIKAKEEYDRIISRANAEASSIIATANKKIEAEREKTLRDVESQVASIAMLAAAKIVNEQGKNLNNSSIYDDFLAGNENKN